MLFFLMKDKRDFFASVATKLKMFGRFGTEDFKDSKDSWGKFTSFFIKLSEKTKLFLEMFGLQ